MLVLDASALVSFLLADESDEVSGAMLEAVSSEDLIAPRLLRWELLSALAIAQRRGRLTPGEMPAKLAQFCGLAFTFDDREPLAGLESELSMARTFEITVYDAAYLELALRRACRLMTRDQDLARAANKLGLLWSP
ncbi:MAG: type II toxin-antitoxin system VapC family toxin [Candidatus Eremiobacteraeota bacterium]|nr:type II toxin-antitoxin system VapC family toxin [Candidatus Eremiobacteraeota bacterium]